MSSTIALLVRILIIKFLVFSPSNAELNENITDVVATKPDEIVEWMMNEDVNHWMDSLADSIVEFMTTFKNKLGKPPDQFVFIPLREVANSFVSEMRVKHPDMCHVKRFIAEENFNELINFGRSTTLKTETSGSATESLQQLEDIWQSNTLFYRKAECLREAQTNCTTMERHLLSLSWAKALSELVALKITRNPDFAIDFIGKLDSGLDSIRFSVPDIGTNFKRFRDETITTIDATQKKIQFEIDALFRSAIRSNSDIIHQAFQVKTTTIDAFFAKSDQVDMFRRSLTQYSVGDILQSVHEFLDGFTLAGKVIGQLVFEKNASAIASMTREALDKFQEHINDKLTAVGLEMIRLRESELNFTSEEIVQLDDFLSRIEEYKSAEIKSETLDWIKWLMADIMEFLRIQLKKSPDQKLLSDVENAMHVIHLSTNKYHKSRTNRIYMNFMGRTLKAKEKDLQRFRLLNTYIEVNFLAAFTAVYNGLVNENITMSRYVSNTIVQMALVTNYMYVAALTEAANDFHIVKVANIRAKIELVTKLLSNLFNAYEAYDEQIRLISYITQEMPIIDFDADFGDADDESGDLKKIAIEAKTRIQWNLVQSLNNFLSIATY